MKHKQKYNAIQSLDADKLLGDAGDYLGDTVLFTLSYVPSVENNWTWELK